MWYGMEEYQEGGEGEKESRGGPRFNGHERELDTLTFFFPGSSLNLNTYQLWQDHTLFRDSKSKGAGTVIARDVQKSGQSSIDSNICLQGLHKTCAGYFLPWWA